MAVGFAVLVNLATASTLLWSDLLSPGTRLVTWAAVAVVWGGSALFARFQNRRDARAEISGSAEDAYPEALAYYLKGNWFEAERVLTQSLRRNPRDVDARLLLATLLRHTKRCDEAARELDRLQRLDCCYKWQLEIYRERQWLSEDSAEREAPAGEPEKGPEDEAASQQAA